jgi:hypothetical protein
MKQVLKHNNSYKQETLYKDENRGALCKGGSQSLNCELCRKSCSCLTPIDFSKMVWVQGERLQLISKNEDIKRFGIELCYDCCMRIFISSVPCINFNKQLFNVLAGVKNG